MAPVPGGRRRAQPIDLMHHRESVEQQTAGVLGSELLSLFELVRRRTS